MIDQLRRALLLWQEIQVNDGLPERTEGGGRRGSFRSFEAEAKLEELNEAIDLDPTGVTSAMILRYMVEKYVDAWAYSFREVMAGDHLKDRSFRLAWELRSLLSCRQIQEAVGDFQDHLGECLSEYKAKPESIALSRDALKVGVLRRDALRAMEHLDAYQFLQGDACEGAERVNPGVYSFLNVNSAIEAVTRCGQLGVTLAMIRGGDVNDDAMSYFAFFVFNGGTLTMLTDKDRWCHPRQHSLIACRGTGKIVAARMEKAHFPYELLNVKFGDKGKRASVSQVEGLLDWQFQMSKVADVNSVEAESVVWLVMMFDLIRQRYIRENLKLPELAYTAETVLRGVESKSSLIARDGYIPAVLPDVKGSDLTADKTSHQWRSESTRFNEWLVDRYNIPDSTLNMISTEDGRLVPIESDDGGLALLQSYDEPDDDEEWGRPTSGRRRSLSETLSAMTPTAFGTLRELSLDKEWAARFNQATLLDGEYKREVENRRDEIIGWITSRIEKNAESIVEASVRQELIVDRSRKVKGCRIGGGGIGPAIGEDDEPRDIVGKIQFAPSGDAYYGWTWYGSKIVFLDEGRLADNRKHACLVDGSSKSTFFVQFCPVCPHDVAALCGCDVDDLPDLLRHHFFAHEPYGGNHLLNRLDPMDWVVKNHTWEAFRFCVVACFSRRGYNAKRRELSLDKIKDWDEYRQRDD